jgi:hypothetical protein
MGSIKYGLVSGEYILEFKVHSRCLNGMNEMELGNNLRVTFLVSFPFSGN